MYCILWPFNFQLDSGFSQLEVVVGDLAIDMESAKNNDLFGCIPPGLFPSKRPLLLSHPLCINSLSFLVSALSSLFQAG